MLRTFSKIENETIEVGKLAQIADNRITTRFPLLKKGIDFKSTVTTSYPSGSGALCKVDNNIITGISNVLYLSEYRDNIFTELSATTLLTGTIIRKIIRLDNNRIICLYHDKTTVGCYLLNVDIVTNTIVVIERFTISSVGSSNSRIDMELISKNKIAISYREKSTQSNSNPCFIVIRVDETGIKMLQEPTKLDVEFSNYGNMYITKLNKDTFIGSYCTINLGTTTVHSVIFEINSTDVLTEITTLKYRGYYSDMTERYIKPVYLADNKIIMFEFSNNFNFNIVLKEAHKDLSTGVYTFNTISTLKAISINPHYVHNVDLLRVKEDDSRDFIMFNRQLINIDANNTTLTEVDSFPLFSRTDVNAELLPTIQLDDNLLLYLHSLNDFKTYSYTESNGNIIGVVKNGDGENYSVILTGLVEDIAGANFEVGKGVYYDSTGSLTSNDLGTLIGYAVSSNSFILRPEMINMPEIIRDDGEGYLHNNKNYYHGFISYIDETIKNGQVYYLDNLGNLTTTETNIRVGIGFGKGLYVKI